MTVVFAGAGAVLAVLAVFEALASVDGAHALLRIERALAPARRAGRAGHRPGRRERRRLALTATGALGAAGWVLGGPALALVLAVCGPLASAGIVRARRRRWRAALAAGAPAAARALADALAAGHGVAGAVPVAAVDGAVTGPARQLLGDLGASLGLGLPLPDALALVDRRAGPGPWRAITAGLRLQRHAGGDLGRLLRELADGADAAARVEADARAASAQARLTARIVIALPVLAAALGELAAPGTVASVLAAPLPRALIAGAVVLQALALVAVGRVARGTR